MNQRLKTLLVCGLVLGSLTGCEFWRKLTGTDDNSLPPASSAAQKPPSPAASYRVWILDGQSNMFGAHQGPLGHAAPFPPLDHYVGMRQGPGYGFAAAYLADHPTEYIKTVNCSLGGTSIVAHQEGLPLFEGCLSNLQEQTTSSDTLEGILWWQGEADAVAEMSGPSWNQLFQAYIDSMRRRNGKPNLPVLFVQLGSLIEDYTVTGAHYQMGTWIAIQDAQASFICPHVAMVRSEDQTLADYVHYDAASNMVIGRRLYEASKL